MYINDTDLLYWGETPDTSDEDLIEKVQWEVDLWVDIVNATGGMLKLIECSLFLLTYTIGQMDVLV